MANYYFLGTLLPELKIGEKPALDFDELQTLLADNLTPGDFAKTRFIHGFYDLQNIRAFWLNEPLDPWGSLDRNELEEALLTQVDSLPKYVFAFMQEHETLQSRLDHFPVLFAKFFEETAEEATGFLHEYFLFELNLRLILTAYRARQLGRDLSRELQHHDAQNEIVAQLLAQKDAKTFEPPVGFEDLKPLLEEHYTSPIDLHQALLQYRFNKMEQLVGLDTFSINRILLYVIQYSLVDKWFQLDKEKGLKIVDTIVKEAT